MYTRYISRELRTPLNTIFVGLKVILDDFNRGRTDKFESTVLDMQTSTDLTISILNDLLTSDKIIIKSLLLDVQEIEPWLFVQETLCPMLLEVGHNAVRFKFSTNFIIAKTWHVQSCRCNCDCRSVMAGRYM